MELPNPTNLRVRATEDRFEASWRSAGPLSFVGVVSMTLGLAFSLGLLGLAAWVGTWSVMTVLVAVCGVGGTWLTLEGLLGRVILTVQDGVLRVRSVPFPFPVGPWPRSEVLRVDVISRTFNDTSNRGEGVAHDLWVERRDGTRERAVVNLKLHGDATFLARTVTERLQPR